MTTNLIELARQAFCGMHPRLWDALKDKGYPEWRSAGCRSSEADAEDWITLLTPAEIEAALGNRPSVNAARAAVDAHGDALGIEGDASIQMMHLLASLHEYCAVNVIDFDDVLAAARTELLPLSPH